MTKEQMLGYIQQASFSELARLRQTEPSESPWFKGEILEAIKDRITELRRDMRWLGCRDYW